jgi:hypothetical protein
VQTWVNDMEKAGVGASTVAASYNLLSKMLADAVLSKKLHASPCVEITLPTIVPPAERWLTPHEYDRIQLALANRVLRIPRTNRSRPDPLAPDVAGVRGARLLLGAALPGELAGLDVEHLDFDRNLVRVQQVLTRHGMKDYPKTGAGCAALGAVPRRGGAAAVAVGRGPGEWPGVPRRPGRPAHGDRDPAHVAGGARSRPGWSTSTRIRCGTRARQLAGAGRGVVGRDRGHPGALVDSDVGRLPAHAAGGARPGARGLWAARWRGC